MYESLVYKTERLDFHRIISGATFTSNSYVIVNVADRSCILVDVGLTVEPISKFIIDEELSLAGVLCTHGHFDHVGRAFELVNSYPCNVYMHKLDLKVAKANNFLLMAFGMQERIKLPSFTLFATDNFSFDLSGTEINFIHHPGHTPGSCLVEVDGALFTGDSVYASGVGLVDLPGENISLLRKSFLKNIDVIQSSKVILPGHGSSVQGSELLNKNTELNSFLYD